VSSSNVWLGWDDTTKSYALHWDGRQWHTMTAPCYADTADIVPDGKGGYWFGTGKPATERPTIFRFDL
jgi:hypothetical protein